MLILLRSYSFIPDVARVTSEPRANIKVFASGIVRLLPPTWKERERERERDWTRENCITIDRGYIEDGVATSIDSDRSISRTERAPEGETPPPPPRTSIRA